MISNIKLTIFDKDGTLVKPASGQKFVQNPTDQRLLPGVAELIAELKKSGSKIAIASNQGGVAAGHKSPSDEQAEMLFLKSLLPEIDLIISCPDFEGQTLYQLRFYSRAGEAPIESLNNRCHTETYRRENHDCYLSANGRYDSFRKPGAGMLQWAIQHFEIPKAFIGDRPEDREAIYIGDRPEDREAAAGARIAFVDAIAWRSRQIVINTVIA